MSLNGANRTNHLARIVPNLTTLIQDEYGNIASYGNNGYGSNAAGSDLASSAGLGGGVATLTYEDSDLNAITRSQMSQDLIAYRYDLEFCQTQLTTQPDLSPQEIRTLQIRILDCGHNIRHCKHRIQMLDAQARLGAAPYSSPFRGSGASTYRSGGTAAPTGKHKRQRIRKSEGGEFGSTANDNGGLIGTVAGGEADVDADADVDGADDSILAVGTDARMTPLPGAPTTTLQRLGYWDCRLCRSRKYLEAGPNRVPSAPCKWPLKDISKMINHFLDLHTEHTPKERCSELGDALARNRGPFEYWLTRTKAQEIEDVSIVNDYVRMLQEGALPDAMRGLLRAATLFPNTVSNSYKK
ncbi:hypothetical protein F4823DRAFT_420467 [Ustulina deusta]|nr:hypothetical protein F4823DRAFT_420467 [Ustulina deusta]